MAVFLYFGLPGCGKTTMMTAIAYKYARAGKPYKNIYCNVDIKVPLVTYITNECIGQYDLSDCLLLIDEATLFADSRDFKNFDKARLQYFLEHRHYKADIMLFTQQWDGVDRKIRTITDRVYYIYKGKILGHWFSSCVRIPYGIDFPNEKKSLTGAKYGDIVQGYCKPPLMLRLFAQRIYRPKWYKYFDSFEKPYLPPLPERYKPYLPENFSFEEIETKE